jgi:TPP-dependent pyruvate/acetoin dehydrogenase alpha subunit
MSWPHCDACVYSPEKCARKCQRKFTPESLLAFEEEIAQEFATGSIRSPVHLSGGNEQQLIELFEDVQADDWVLCSWRSHYHCLLKGVSREKLRESIRRGNSVSLCFAKQKVLSSGIVGGVAPIALGIAWELKRKNDETHNHETRVWVFLGDMTAESGIVHEAMKYAARHGLPIKWVIEDNGQSVCTPTQESWGDHPGEPDVTRYHYALGRPHAGIGQWVRF